MKWPKDYKAIEEFADKHNIPYEEAEGLVLFYIHKTQKERDKEWLKYLDKTYLKYCQLHNGVDYCKNCGLSLGDIKRDLARKLI